MPCGPGVRRGLVVAGVLVAKAAVDPVRLDTAADGGATPEDRERLRALAGLYHGFHDRIEGRFADR